MTTLEDVRKTIEAVISNLTPEKAQDLAKGLSDPAGAPGAAKEQVSKMAADMLEWSQRSRDRLREVISREIASQMKSMGLASQADLDAIKKRVRDLERRAGTTATGRGSPAKKATAKRTTAKKTTSRKAISPKSAAKTATVNPAANAAP